MGRRVIPLRKFGFDDDEVIEKQNQAIEPFLCRSRCVKSYMLDVRYKRKTARFAVTVTILRISTTFSPTKWATASSLVTLRMLFQRYLNVMDYARFAFTICATPAQVLCTKWDSRPRRCKTI